MIITDEDGAAADALHRLDGIIAAGSQPESLRLTPVEKMIQAIMYLNDSQELYGGIDKEKVAGVASPGNIGKPRRRQVKEQFVRVDEELSHHTKDIVGHRSVHAVGADAAGDSQPRQTETLLAPRFGPQRSHHRYLEKPCTAPLGMCRRARRALAAKNRRQRQQKRPCRPAPAPCRDDVAREWVEHERGVRRLPVREHEEAAVGSGDGQVAAEQRQLLADDAAGGGVDQEARVATEDLVDDSPPARAEAEIVGVVLWVVGGGEPGGADGAEVHVQVEVVGVQEAARDAVDELRRERGPVSELHC